MIINFMGDLIFGDQPAAFGFGFDSMHKPNDYKGIFNDVQIVFDQADYNIANFESILKERPKKPSVSNWSMCCDSKIIRRLKEANINIVNIANNHTMDYGLECYLQTKNILEKNSITVIGDKEKPYTIIEDKHLKLAIIGVSYLKVKSPEVGYFYNPTKEAWSSVFEELNNLNVSKRIIFIHWGNEFVSNPVDKQLSILDDLLMYDVDAVVGHHPHVLQPSCLYKGVPVFFSIGNFVSDYWQERARKSVIINLEIQNNVQWKWNKYDCIINSKGCPQTDNIKSDVEFNTNVETSSLEDVNAARKRLRSEYLRLLINNFHKIENKPQFMKWILRRVIFIIRFGKQEKKNPDIIYEKYKH